VCWANSSALGGEAWELDTAKIRQRWQRVQEYEGLFSSQALWLGGLKPCCLHNALTGKPALASQPMIGSSLQRFFICPISV
jgi:hypothetical protein